MDIAENLTDHETCHRCGKPATGYVTDGPVCEGHFRRLKGEKWRDSRGPGWDNEPASPPDSPATRVVCPEKKVTVIMLAREDGTPLAQLNVCAWAEGRGNVDVILAEGQRGTFLAWHEGKPQLRHQTKAGTTVHAVAIDREGRHGR